MERIANIGTAPIPKQESIVQERTRSAGSPSPAAPAAPEATDAPTREQLHKFADDLREALNRAKPSDWRVGFHEDSASGKTVIEIKDAEGEVVKQFPPEIVLNLHRKLDDLAGVVIDETT